MQPIKSEWTAFQDFEDKLDHYRRWGLVPPKSKKLRPVMVVDGYFGIPEPCDVVGYVDGYPEHDWAVIELPDGFHGICGEYLAELQPSAFQRLPFGVCFAEILQKYIVIDIETTGLNRHNDAVIEIAAITYEYGKKISEFHRMVDPGRKIPLDVTKLTGISDLDVQDAPSINDVAPDFLKYIGDLPLVGHNILTFDLPFLSEQFSCEIENTTVDTLPMAREAFDLLPMHKLEYLNDALQLESNGSHRALNDVETTNALLWACMAPRRFEHHVNKAFLKYRIENGSRKNAAKRSVPQQKKNSSPKKYQLYNKIDLKDIKPREEFSVSGSPLAGKNIVFTGELSIPRNVAMQMAVDAGATLKSSVSTKVNFLVVGKQDASLVGNSGLSTKEEKAISINSSGKGSIKILSEDEFLSYVKEMQKA